MEWKLFAEKMALVLQKQPSRAGKLTTDEINGMLKPFFKDPDLIQRTLDLCTKYDGKIPFPGFSAAKMIELQHDIDEMNELEPQMMEALQVLRHGRMILNDEFWTMISKAYQYSKVMAEVDPELNKDAAFLGDLLRERAKSSESDKKKQTTSKDSDTPSEPKS